MGKIITFGEIMLRLAPDGYYRFVQAENYGATFGGGEANVSVSLANYGLDTAFVTKLPSHEIGQAAVNSLRRFGVDTNFITRGGPRVGIYYLEKGASQRPSKVIYDRAGSSIALAEKQDFDWDKIFEGASWFHFTGITPALGDNVAEICLEACKKAHEKGITVSCDLNYRKKPMSAPLVKMYYRNNPRIVKKLLERHQLYNRTVELLRNWEKDNRAFVIRPSEPIGIRRIEKDPDKLQEVYELGVRDAGKYLPKLREYIAGK